MQKFVFTSLCCSFVASFAACGNQEGYHSYEDAQRYVVGDAEFSASEVREVDIDWWGGSVEIEQSVDKVSIIEEETSQAEAERMRYYLDDGVLKIRYCRSGMRSRVAAQSKNLLVTIPAGVALHLDYENASVSVGNLETTEFSVEGVAGNFTAERIVCGEAELETESGKMTVGELIAKEVCLETQTGSISISQLSADYIEGDVHDGALYLGLEKAVKTSEPLESDKGNVTLALGEGLSAEIYFQTAAGSLQTEKPYRQDGKRYSFTEATETGRCAVSVKTRQGNLIVR